jgi:hypothetical protein
MIMTAVILLMIIIAGVYHHIANEEFANAQQRIAYQQESLDEAMEIVHVQNLTIASLYEAMGIQSDASDEYVANEVINVRRKLGFKDDESIGPKTEELVAYYAARNRGDNND